MQLFTQELNQFLILNVFLSSLVILTFVKLEEMEYGKIMVYSKPTHIHKKIFMNITSTYLLSIIKYQISFFFNHLTFLFHNCFTVILSTTLSTTLSTCCHTSTHDLFTSFFVFSINLDKVI